MNLKDIISRNLNPSPWEEGEKIPWDEPGFSQRMLREHLSQKHDAASRRRAKIAKQAQWIHNFVLNSAPSRVLDLGCGPGLYAAKFSALGHACHGIDFSPASITYAEKNFPANCQYTLADIRSADYGSAQDLVMLIFGEFNVFHPRDAQLILKKAFAALNPDGQLLLEVSTFDDIYQKGNQPSMWYSSTSGLFSDNPYLCLMESFWEEKENAAIERYLVVDAANGQVQRFSSSSKAYSDEEFGEMFDEAGFSSMDVFPSLTGVV